MNDNARALLLACSLQLCGAAYVTAGPVPQLAVALAAYTGT